MTEVLHSPSHFPSSPPTTSSLSSSSSSVTCIPPQSPSTQDGIDDDEEELVKQKEKNQRDQLSLLALLVALLRKSLVACKSDRREFCASMEIGCPTNVRHVAHVTFDRFNGFLGLPVEFEPEVPRRPPSASATVFGVSTESMQLSYDSRGNSVPTILLLMQRRLYAQGGLQAEGVFRIAAENSQEEYVREQLNGGVVPEGVDVHCLAGLIKAWFRELPTGVLDSLSPEQVIECRTEDDCAYLARNLPPTEAALLDWAINLMADVVQQEHLNKMNAHNVATVFAPNMTQMADPLTALMYAVQVMNFLKTLILRTLREREDSLVEPTPSRIEPFDKNGHESPSLSCAKDSEDENETTEQAFVAEEPVVESSYHFSQYNAIADEAGLSYTTSVDKLIAKGDRSCETASEDNLVNDTYNHRVNAGNQAGIGKNSIGQSSNSSLRKSPGKFSRQSPVLHLTPPSDKTRGIGSCIDSRSERIEAWR
ncbi:rho GTPase-activating protein 5-like [Populus alba x Populus x berolinensis]|uniref:Rho GTPase-activating protein 5-like n=1 Tax=Populus alba x Populus x berolinensis TaxID=444605 RepID=A0AAD6R3R0_9ROSI|nr:rho GTPase-activating protein 5-like [Populus alba x Populus x berolinensis]KAJ7001815.1 rho GTPase-activating protein 5-like [Populus alba x Populus x berolinensis]